MLNVKSCYNCRYRDCDEIDRNIDFCSIYIKEIEEIENTEDIKNCPSHKFTNEEKVNLNEYWYEEELPW